MQRIRQIGWIALKRSQQVALAFGGFFLVLSIVIPAIPSVFLGGHNQIIARESETYEFFAQQPKDTVIASLLQETANIATFSKRSVLTGKEYALPYHLGYYNQIRQRTIDLIQAQYSLDVKDLQQFIKRYNVDFFLFTTGDFSPQSITTNFWLMQYQPQANEAIAQLQQRSRPALARLARQCSAFETEYLVVVKANCIAGAQLK